MSDFDRTQVTDHGTIGASMHACDGIHWQVRGRLEKFNAGIEDVRAGRYISSTNPSDRLGQPVEPYEVVNTTGNLLLRGGADVMWLGLIGGLTATTGVANTYYNNGNASIGVSTSSVGAASTQTNLQGTNQYWKGMDVTYPLHTTGTLSTANLNIQFKATYSTAQANFAWNEWAIGNSTNSTGANSQRVLNRKVQSLGTKSTAATWAFTATLSLA